MKIGFMGLGKLGLPCALAIEAVGHEVIGYDPDATVVEIMNDRRLPYLEAGAQDLLEQTRIRLVSSMDLVEQCDMIFVTVQTPHQPAFEGVHRLPMRRVDFDYQFLERAMKALAFDADLLKKDIHVVIISTVLPGTIDRVIRPLLNEHVKLCYNPFFIAMGTTIHDFTHPEFVLFGVDDPDTASLAESFYKTIHDRPFYRTTIRNAEMIKVSYNTFISTKLAFVNTLMEVCHKTGCDVDAVTNGLKMSTDRLISTRYLTAGMGDGGGCHPRDNIALSHLARKLELGFDFFEAIMKAREGQTDWFADLIVDACWKDGLPIFILGEAFKPETNLVTGSPAVLLENLLKERGLKPTVIDPIVHSHHQQLLPCPDDNPAVYFIGTRHEVFSMLHYPKGSTVIDPHRYVPDQYGVTVIRLGEGEK